MLMAQSTFWDDPVAAREIIDKDNQLKEISNNIKEMNVILDDAQVAYEMQQEEYDSELQKELEQNIITLCEKVKRFELSQMLNQPYDRNNAIIEIHPGAGGTESQDWGSMLLRMYHRWAEKRNYQVEVLDYLAGDEAGIKSVSFLIKGVNAFGYLRSERGVHRLVRISPFDSANRRHTSFASVDVMPEMNDNIEIEVSNDDLKIDTFRASGAGGQHINKTESAVRITHLPTGIVVASQAQRSQLKNREIAMNMLKSKLYQLQLEKQAEEQAAIRGEQMENGWGSQIRSYVFHPYSMVKDHRTQCETGNAQSVLDGDLDDFIDSFLRWQMKGKEK